MTRFSGKKHQWKSSRQSKLHAEQTKTLLQRFNLAGKPSNYELRTTSMRTLSTSRILAVCRGENFVSRLFPVVACCPSAAHRFHYFQVPLARSFASCVDAQLHLKTITRRFQQFPVFVLPHSIASPQFPAPFFRSAFRFPGSFCILFPPYFSLSVGWNASLMLEILQWLSFLPERDLTRN